MSGKGIDVGLFVGFHVRSKYRQRVRPWRKDLRRYQRRIDGDNPLEQRINGLDLMLEAGLSRVVIRCGSSLAVT